MPKDWIVGPPPGDEGWWLVCRPVERDETPVTVGTEGAFAMPGEPSDRTESFRGPWPRFVGDGSVEWMYPPGGLPGPEHVPGVVIADYDGGGTGTVSVARRAAGDEPGRGRPKKDE